MLERLVETFCAADDFCKTFLPQWEAYLIGSGTAPLGPVPGLAVSEIITILLALHDSQFKYLKSTYNEVTGEVLRRYFLGMPCYERFVTLQPNALVPRLGFFLSRRGQPTGIYYFGFKLHLVFNHLNEIVAIKLTPAMFTMAHQWNNSRITSPASSSVTRAISESSAPRLCSNGDWYW